MIDIDRYEPAQMDWILHITRGHSPDGWRKLSKSLIELSDDDRLLVSYAPLLLAEVKRLRERLIRAYDWAENAVNGNDSAMMDYTEYVCGGEEND
jgi:hypothetical protein